MATACCPQEALLPGSSSIDRTPRFPWRAITLVLGTLATVLVTSMPAVAQDSDDRSVELARIRGEIESLESKLDGMRARASTLEDKLARTEIELELQETQLAEATAARDLAVVRIDETEIRIGGLERSLVAVQDDLAQRLGGLHRLGRHGYLRLFLAIETDASLLQALRQLRYLAQRDRQALDRFRTTRDTLTVEHERLEAHRGEMESWQAREQERRDQVAAVRRRQAGLLSQLERQRREAAVRQEALRDKAQRLASFINALVDQRAVPLAGRPIQNFEGVLDWPLEGRVAIPFGPRTDPRYRTEVPHNGVSIDAVVGVQVRGVYPGEVVYAGAFEGYGPMVVLHHPGRVFTLYGGLGELRVAKGDVVTLNTIVGTASDRLYFEIRRDNQPEDPLGWLR